MLSQTLNACDQGSAYVQRTYSDRCGLWHGRIAIDEQTILEKLIAYPRANFLRCKSGNLS